MSIHISGIAGKGMAPAAGLALTGGKRVTGDDLVENHRIAPLRAAGAQITVGKNIDPPLGSKLHVSSSLIPRGSINVPQRSRLGFVNDLMHEAANATLAIAGSVGKSSAASIIWAAHRAIQPACYIGADVPGTLCGGLYATGTVAVVEADEYRDAYVDLAPERVILLNVTPNHGDHFGPGTTGFSRSFTNWVKALNLKPEQVLLSSAAAAEVTAAGLPTPGTVVGDAPDTGAHWHIEVVSATPSSSVFAISRGKVRDKFRVPLTGEHAVLAAAYGVVAARGAGLSDRDIQAGLDTSQLPWRRQSLVHEGSQVLVYDDNARLPEQFVVTIEGLRQRHPGYEIVAIISPWGRLNRRDIPAWATVGTYADVLVVLPVGDAGLSRGGVERDDADRQLVEATRALGGVAMTVSHWEELPRPTNGTVYLTVGYDAQYTLFRRIHQYLQAQYPAKGLGSC